MKPKTKTRLTLSIAFILVLLAALIPTGLGVLGRQSQVRAASDITITEFPLPTSNSYPHGITTGPDGNLWFTEYGANKIGKVTPGGSFTEYSLPSNGSAPEKITTGPDGNLWFTEGGTDTIGKITLSGVVTEYPIPTTAGSYPYGITAGPDGNLWFTEAHAGQIGRVSPSGSFAEYPVPTGSSSPYGITTGPDGALWFTELSAGQIGKVTPDGSFTEYSLPIHNSYPTDITVGSDGNLWFTEPGSMKIGRIFPSGTLAEYPTPSGYSPSGITAGPDGNIWFMEYYASIVSQITPNGTITEFPIRTSDNYPWGITTGSDGNLWFIENIANKIGRVNLSSVATPTPSPTPQPVVGKWISPNSGDTIHEGKQVSLSVQADAQGGHIIDHVNVNAWWQGVNPKQWITVCPSVHATSGTDQYSCTWDFTSHGQYIPAGKVKFSFDVFYKGRKTAYRPDGIRMVNYIHTLELLAPFPKGTKFSIVAGYADLNDPVHDTCSIPGELDHCNNQLFGLDLVPTNTSDQTVISPVSGTVVWTEGTCIFIQMDDSRNLSVCHMANILVGKGEVIPMGKLLGKFDTHVHLNIDEREPFGNKKPNYVPVSFSGYHTLEGNNLPNGHTQKPANFVCPKQTGSLLTVSAPGGPYSVYHQEWMGCTGVSHNNEIP